MKELVAKEFLYLFVGILVSIPVAFIFLYLVKAQPADANYMTSDEKVLEMDLLLIGALLGFAGMYLARFTVWAVKKVVSPES